MDLVLGAIRAEKVTVLFVEHDMDIVRRYTQRILAFYEGKVIADGEPAAVLADPEVRRYVVGEPAPEDAEAHVLTIEGLDVSIKSVRILRGVALELAPGQLAGLIGRNGAGKTTLMRAIMGALSPAAGTITFDGRPLLRASPPTRAPGSASATCPRTGASSRSSPSRRTCCSAGLGRGAKRTRTSGSRRIYKMIPEVEAAPATARGCSSPAASRSSPRWPAPS